MLGLQAVHAVRSGDMPAEEVLELCLARIEAVDPRVRAFTDGCFERATADARALDAMRRRGESLPPLAGLPFAVKNLFDIEGKTTRAGSHPRSGAHHVAAEDAFVVRQLRRAGAVLVGALHMDEFAFAATGENRHDGAAHNPRHLGRMAGGSSSGCGAALAAGEVPLTIGTDTDGSLRIPASLCGVFALKPTFGRLSRRGCFPLAASLDHIGPLARSAADLAAAYDAMQASDPRDPACQGQQMQSVLPTLDHGTHTLRIGVLTGEFETHASRAARRAVHIAAAALGASPGVIWPDAEQARDTAALIAAAEAGQLHLATLRERLEAFEPTLAARLTAATQQPATWREQAQRFTLAHRERVAALFRDWDVLIAPATPMPAPWLGTREIELHGRPQPIERALGALTQPLSLSGCPVAVAPIWPDGLHALPVGVQLIAAPWREDLTLRAARALEAAGFASSPVSAL